MKRKTIYLCVAVVTFITGATFTALLVEKSHPVAEIAIPNFVEPLTIPNPTNSVLEQSTQEYNLELEKRKLDDWFSLLIPKIMGNVERKNSVEGGFYITDTLEIDYDYWIYENTPNWLRGKYAKPVLLACTETSKNTQTVRTKIDGKKAIIQQCSETDERKGFRYIYYVTFPKLKVFNELGYRDGMFNLKIEYKNPSDLILIKQIVHSLDFEK